jgi:hypothetical protein
MRKLIPISGLGFVVPIFWGLFEFVFFNAGNSVVLSALRVAAYVTCPPWLLPGVWGDIASPILNAVLYGGIAWVIVRLRRLRRAKSGP